MARTHTPPRGAGRRALRWAAGLLALALVPKCFVCLAAYVALATGLGTLGVEFCASAPTRGNGARLFTLDVWSLAGLIFALAVAVVALLARRRRSSRLQRAQKGSKKGSGQKGRKKGQKGGQKGVRPLFVDSYQASNTKTSDGRPINKQRPDPLISEPSPQSRCSWRAAVNDPARAV